MLSMKPNCLHAAAAEPPLNLLLHTVPHLLNRKTSSTPLVLVMALLPLTVSLTSPFEYMTASDIPQCSFRWHTFDLLASKLTNRRISRQTLIFCLQLNEGVVTHKKICLDKNYKYVKINCLLITDVSWVDKAHQ